MQYANNNFYLSIGGTDLSAFVINVTLSPSQSSVETTAGSGTDHVSRAEGLEDHSISFTIYSDDANAYSLALLKGEQIAIFGEQGNASGRPKHVQSFILTGVSSPTMVSKEMVIYDVSGEAAAAPTTDMFAGGTWA